MHRYTLHTCIRVILKTHKFTTQVKKSEKILNFSQIYMTSLYTGHDNQEKRQSAHFSSDLSIILPNPVICAIKTPF